MNKKIVSWAALFILLLVGIVLVVWSRPSPPDYPEGVLTDATTYAINPETILFSLEREGVNVFMPPPLNSEGHVSPIWPSGFFSWGQDDYLEIANTLHRFVWKESLEDWRLIRASFKIEQCHKVFNRIDSASLSFYQRENGNNIVHGMWIRPLYGDVTAGEEYSRYTGWTDKWENISLDKVKINTVDSALLIAEENGGREVRLITKDKCQISILLAPDRFEYDMLPHPFTRYGWGWSVIYWQTGPAGDPLFSITIDPYTGDYRIIMSNSKTP